MADLGPEDEKLLTLARAARSRVGAAAGAAVRDRTGRSYSAAEVRLPSLQLTAVQAAVALAVASGADGAEAAALVGAPADTDLSVLRDLGGPGTPLHVAGPDGRLVQTLSA
jgi:hypothetical protein